MPDFSQRSNKKELLDRDDIPFKDIRLNMQELEFINKYLGGHAITLSGFRKIIANAPIGKQWVVCEIGCGGGDNLKAIYRWCRLKGISVNMIGIDINKDCIAYAMENCKDLPGFEWIASDYSKVQFHENTPDIIFSSLFCHHFTNDQLVAQLRWMQQARAGFFINDLHRHTLAYYSIKWLTALFSKSWLVKNDAPVSVLRGFTRADWNELLNKAGIDKFELKWKWAFRWLIVKRC